jgi:YHS domain-containing protein
MIAVRRWIGLALVAGILVVAAGCSGGGESQTQTGDAAETAEATAEVSAAQEMPAGEAVIDPVSGAKVSAEDAPVAYFLDAVYHFESEENRARFRAAPEEFATTTDPVSGEPVRIREASHQTKHAGRSWYFATEENLRAFEVEPEAYATYRCMGCGMTGYRARPTVITETISGHEMQFCCTHCEASFRENAEEYFGNLVPEGGVAE